jgi:hypothetical protein
MTDPNLYNMVFGLPESVREPDYYELLGVPRFSRDIKAIRDAAVRRQSELLKWQNFDDQTAIDRLQGEVVSAVQTLEQTATRNSYDEQLRRRSPNKTGLQATSASHSSPKILSKPNRSKQAQRPSAPVKPSTQSSSAAPPTQKKTHAPDWFSRARELKQEPSDDAIITSPVVLYEDDGGDVGSETAPANRTDKPHTSASDSGKAKPNSPNSKAKRPARERASQPPPIPGQSTASVAVIEPYRLGGFPSAVERLAGRLFLAVNTVASIYLPFERAIFKYLVSFRGMLLGVVLLPLRLLVSLFRPLLNRGVSRSDLAHVASSAWVRLRGHEQHPWVAGTATHRRINIPDRCVECNKAVVTEPRVKRFRIYDRQSVAYLFLMGLIVAYCTEPYLGRWLFETPLTPTQYFASLACAYMISVLAMRPFVRAKSFAISSARCTKHGNSAYPIVTIQSGHQVLHVGSRDLQRDFDKEWVFEKPS